MKVRVLLAFALSSTPAFAQVSTTCMAMGPNMVHCDSTDAGAQAAAEGENLRASGQAIGQAIAQIRERSLRAKLGKMVAAGDCQGATTYAINKGRFDLADGVRQFCSANAPQYPNVALAPAPTANTRSALSPYQSGLQAGQAALAQSQQH